MNGKIDAVFAETHPSPKDALSDGPNMIPLDMMVNFLDQVLAVHNISRNFIQEDTQA